MVETKTEKLIVEIKARKDMEDETVLAKSKAARTWIGYANRHAISYRRQAMALSSGTA